MIVVTGDWHGRFDEAYRKIKEKNISDCSIIQVGDFGIGFELPSKEVRRLERLNEQLRSRNVKLYAFRGNHDDPAYFDGRIWHSNISLLKDYSILYLDGNVILCVGGAISIDRKPNPEIKTPNNKGHKGRKEGVNYWEKEAFVFIPELINASNINIVLTHSAPKFCYPQTKFGLEKWTKHDPELNELCNKEREDHQKLYERLATRNKIDYWFYGHFHKSHQEQIHETKFVLLNELEFFEIRK